MKTIFSQITFINPQILFGLFALIIPVIIHLFNLRRVKKVEFSNTALLRRIKEESSAKRKPVELLILTSRILGIALLVLAFSQPLFKNQENDLDLGKRVMIYLDNSQSSSTYSLSNSTSFDLMINEINSIVNSYPEGTSFYFVENSYSNSISAKFTKESLIELLTEVKQVGVDRSFEEIKSRIDGGNFNGDIYYISDFQNKDGFDNTLTDTLNTYYLIPVLGEDISNIYVDTLYLENTFLSGSFANLLNIRLARNYRDLESINLKLLIDNQLFGTAEIEFGNQLIAEHEFELLENSDGLDKIALEFDDPYLAYDNYFYASVNQLDKVRVVEIFDDSSPDFINALFSENEVFQFTRLDSRFIDNEIVESADFLVVNQVANISNQLIKILNKYKESRGTVMVIPSSRNASAQFGNFGIIASKDTEDRIALNQPDYDNPLFQGVFENEDENIEMPKATVTFRLNNSQLDYLQFRNGRGFLSKVNTTGNLFFFSSPLDAEYTSFTNHALFVPVMYKLALGSKVNLSNLYYYTDSETLFYPLDNISRRNEVYKLQSQQGTITPDQRVDNDQLILEIPKGEIRSGHYGLINGEENIGTISFNIPKSESDLRPVDQQMLDDLDKRAHINVVKSGLNGEVQQFLQAGIAGIPLWKYALLGALFFLFVEIILIRYL